MATKLAKPKKKLTARGAKAKGRNYQQEIRDLILAAFPSLEPDDVRSTAMGASGEDIQLSPAARKLFAYQVECKRLKSIAALRFIDQCKLHGPHEPIAICREDRGESYCIVRFEHFLELIGGQHVG